jgi:hypothetical protein
MALNFNFGPFTASNFGLEPIDLSKVSAPLSNAEIFASASRAASSPVVSGALSSVSTTPTFNPADYGPPSPVVSAPTVDENKVIQDYVNATMASNPNDWVNIVAQRMDEVGVSPSRLQQAFPDLSVEQIQQSYEEARPTGKYSTPAETITINKDFTPAPLSNVETLNINPYLYTVKPTATFDAGEFVGPVAPGSPKSSSTTATNLTLTPSFLSQVQAEEDVRQAFNRVLGRQPFAGSGSGLEYWTNELVKGNVTLADLDQAIAKGAQGDDRLAANKFLGTNYFKVADPTTVPYASLLQPTTTVTDQPSVIETYNKKAQEREEQDKPLFNTWEDIPNIDETEIQMAKDAGYQSPGAYFLAKVESTDPSLSSWRESTRQEILGSKDLKDQYEDLYKPPIDRDAEETIYQELKRQYEVANENGFGYRHESDLEAIWRREAGILAASGVKSIYDIGTRSVDRSSVIEAGSSRPNYQWMTEAGAPIQKVYKLGDDYYYETSYTEGETTRTKIDPARIIDVQEDVRKSYDGESGNESVDYSGFKIRVKDDPRTELVNKNTNDPVYDIELHNEWRDDPSAYNLMGRSGSDIVTIDPNRGFDKIHTNYGVRGAADLSFQMIPDGQGGEIPFILPIYRSTKTDLTPLVFLASAFLGPYAGTIGKYLGFTGAGAAAVGAGVISAGTQLVVNGKIDPGRLLASAATAGIAETGGFTGSDIAVDAAQLAEQGLNSLQITDTLIASGVNSVTATLAGTFASAGIAVEIAPMITAGVQNMGLTALATESLDGDVLAKAFLSGASGEASSLAVDKIIGDENLQAIADATGLSKDQAGSIATSALINGMNAEILDADKSFLDAVTETLVVSGVSTVTANKVATALDDMTSSKGRAAIVGATKNIMDVAGTAAWNDIDVGDALETMAPGIIGSALSTYVRTPETTKTDDKAKVDGVEVAGPADQEALAATRNQPLVGETASTPVTDESGTTRRTVSGENNEGQSYSYTIVTDSDGNVSYSYQTTTGDMVTSATRPNLKSTQEEGGVEVTPVTISNIEEKALEPTVSKDNALEEIGKETTFSGAFDKARDLLGPGETFDWKGKSYSTATAEERPDLAPVKPGDNTQTDTGAAFHMNVGRKYTDAEMNILNASLNDLVNNVNQVNAPTSEMDFATAAVTGQEVPVVGDKISSDIIRPFVATLGAATRGAAEVVDYTRGTLEGMEVIDRNSPLWKGMTDMADAMQTTADFQIGDYLKSKEQNLIKTVSDADLADKPAALVRAIYENPTALLTMGISEMVNEAPSIAAMALLAGPTAVYKVLSLGVGGLTNFVETFGQSYNETRDLGVKSGMTEDEAHTAAQKSGVASGILSATLGTLAEAPLVRKAFGPGGISTSIKREMATEPFEEGGQQAVIEYLATGKVDINNVATAAVIAPAVAGTTTGMIGTALSIDSTGEAANAVISANDPENSSAISQEVSNILGSSTNIQDATQSITSTLTDMGMDPAAALAVGNTVAAEQVVNNINSQLPEDSKFSINNLNTLVGATDQGAPVTLGEYIGSSVSNVGPNIFVSPDIAIGTKNDGSILTVAGISGSLDMTQTKGDITTQTTTQTNPDTNTTIKTETKTGPDTNITTTTETNPDNNVTTKTETNVNPDTNTAVEVKTETNPDQNTETNTVTNNETNIQTEIKVDANTVVATEINLDTNIKTDITTNIDKIIEDLVDTGVKPEDALKIAVEEVKEDAKSKKSTTAQKSGAGTALTGAGMALPALGSLVDEGRDLNPLVTTGKREFESPLAAFMRMVSGEEDVEPPPVEKKEPSMDYYSYGKSAEIDDVLGDATSSGLPSFEFAELGEMGPSFQMRSGGLVPPFAGGGPLTMAAGKLRKDYRQGDAVEGPGDGQSDDIPAMLADGEFVIPADVVAALGNGSNKAGADKLYDMMHNIRRQARKGNPKDLPKPAKSPLQYMTRR